MTASDLTVGVAGEYLRQIARGEVAPEHLVSIIVPHFETPELCRLCLRAIRLHTRVPYEIIVVDNGSRDGESLEYLRRVEWIRLIERSSDEVPATAAEAHATALNIGLEAARGEFVLVMHTDTIALGPQWLDDLRQMMLDDARLAAVGSDKIDGPGPVGSFFKKIGDGKSWRRLWYRLSGRRLPEKLRVRPPHARSFCAMYRRQAVLDCGLDFVPRRMQTAGEEVYHGLRAGGWNVRLLPAPRMRQLVAHVVHATALLSAKRRINTGRVRRRTERRIKKLFAEPWVRGLLEDDRLDRA